MLSCSRDFQFPWVSYPCCRSTGCIGYQCVLEGPPLPLACTVLSDVVEEDTIRCSPINIQRLDHAPSSMITFKTPKKWSPPGGQIGL